MANRLMGNVASVCWPTLSGHHHATTHPFDIPGQRIHRAHTRVERPLNAEKRAGTFVCAACFLPLFDAVHKYESGTGWPSFWQPLLGALGTSTDYKALYPRTEYHCSRCGGHQGHVFDDGPRPTGKRYCNNGVALAFVPQGQPLPALRT